MSRILIYAPVVGRGGVHRMITRLLFEWLEQSDHEFVILSQQRDEAGVPIHWPKGLEFVQAGEMHAPLHPHLFDWLTTYQFKFVDQWASLHPDLAYLPMPWWTTRLQGFEPPSRFAVTIHDFAWDQLQEPSPELSAEARIFARFAGAAAFPSDYQRMWGKDFYGFRNSRTIYYGHFIPAVFQATPEEAARVGAKYGLPERYTLAFHCANGKKDPITILKGQIKARAASGAVPPLVIAGLESEYFIPGRISHEHHAFAYSQMLQSAISTLGYNLGDDLFVLEYVPEADLGGLYAGATAALTATRNEGGISGTMFEAFASRTPSIYTDLPMFSERLTPGQFGYVFHPGDSEGLAEQIVDVHENRAKARARAQKAFDFAYERTWADAAAEYLEMFQHVLEPRVVRKRVQYS